ncbi:MAG: methylthioadenosine phosphorylase [Chloroflexi bacterium RBG_16_56_11]|nr:MAG: methylthioadenosine phosphorylase [Chloroflexi bacterium RBG_16_56_11]
MPIPEARLAVIGGTGLYDIEGLTDVTEVRPETPFGRPSDIIVVGRLGEVGIAFLPRHGKGHRISPTGVPSRANIYALKALGVEFIISSNSCGSFKEELKPGHLLVPDQVIDRTRQRASTFFSEGIVAHIQFADPFCPVLSRIVYESAVAAGATVHRGGTFVVMEGPAFSTRAESRLYRSWGADVIGMTVLPEAKLAREAEICYASIGCITDYDSWHETRETVTVEAILTTMRNNIDHARKTIRLAAGKIPEKRDCACATALGPAIVTDLSLAPAAQKKKLDLLIGKYLKKA